VYFVDRIVYDFSCWSSWVSWHHISQKYTSSAVSTFLITMRLFTSYHFSLFLCCL